MGFKFITCQKRNLRASQNDVVLEWYSLQLIKSYRRLEAEPSSRLLTQLTSQINAMRSSQKTETIYQSTGCNIPGDLVLERTVLPHTGHWRAPVKRAMSLRRPLERTDSLTK